MNISLQLLPIMSCIFFTLLVKTELEGLRGTYMYIVTQKHLLAL